MCPGLRELSRTQFGDFVFYYVSREHTNVLHARSSLGVAAPGAAGVRIPPPSEVRAGAGEGRGRGEERDGARRRRSGTLETPTGSCTRVYAQLLHPQMLLTRFFSFS